jgi:hypothetical protein
MKLFKQIARQMMAFFEIKSTALIVIKKITINVIQHNIGYEIYDRFTVEHFPLRQSMILTTNFFCSRQYLQFLNK